MQKRGIFRQVVLGAGAAIAAALLAGCGIHGLQMDQSPLTKVFTPKSGHIAYIGTDGNVYVGNQAGNPVEITHDGQVGTSATVSYTTPVWSFDGKQIAFARYVRGGSATLPSSVEVFTVQDDGKALTRVFSSETVVPFYIYWSPNDELIGFLSQEQDNQGAIEMGYISASPGNDYRAVHTDAPFYWQWSPDSSTIIAHTQVGNAQDAPDFIEIDKLGPAGIETRHLNLELGAFDTPAVLPDGKKVIVPIGTATGAHLVVLDLATNEQRSLTSALNNIFYSLSPDGKRLAFIDQSKANDSASQVLHVVDVTDPKNSFEAKERPVFAYYWSPNSDYVAIVTPVQSKATIDQVYAQSKSLPYVQLSVVDARNRSSWVVARYPMTQIVLNDIPFNDQYQRSSTIWSPNSRFLVYTAYTANGAPGVFVAPADGNLKGSLIAAGDLASWSWK